MKAKIEKQKTKTSTEKIEHETLTIQVPKVLMNFLRDNIPKKNMTTEAYLESAVIERVAADLDNDEYFGPKQKELVARYHLEELNKVIKGVIPSYFLIKET
jgi:hypothetical protein